MRLKDVRFEAKKETVVAENANFMKEEIDTKTELTVVYTGGCEGEDNVG